MSRESQGDPQLLSSENCRELEFSLEFNTILSAIEPDLSKNGPIKKESHGYFSAEKKEVKKGSYKRKWMILLLMEEILHHLGCIKPCK